MTKTVRALACLLLLLFVGSACSLMVKRAPFVAITPEARWTPLPQPTAQPVSIKDSMSSYPFDDTVLIFFQDATEHSWIVFDLSTRNSYNLSMLPEKDLLSAPIVAEDGSVFLHFENELMRLSPDGQNLSHPLPETASGELRCDFQWEGALYCLSPDLTEVYVVQSDLSYLSLPLTPFEHTVESDFYPLYRTSNGKVRALYPSTLHMVLDEGIYLRDFDFAAADVEEHLFKMYLDRTEDALTLEFAAADPESYISTVEPIPVLAIPDNMSRAYFNKLEQPLFEGEDTYYWANYINLSTGLVLPTNLDLMEGLPVGAITYRDRLVIPRKELEETMINFSYPEAYDLKDLRTTLELADWLPFGEPLMEIHPYREGWMLLTSTELYYLNNEGIILRSFALPEQVSQLLKAKTPHILSQPLEP